MDQLFLLRAGSGDQAARPGASGGDRRPRPNQRGHVVDRVQVTGAGDHQVRRWSGPAPRHGPPGAALPASRAVAAIRERLAQEDALVGATDHGTTKALYGRDPDGLEFEVSWLVPADLITDDIAMTSRRLDLDAEISRFGAETLSGIGISRVRPVEV